jgi:Ca2+-binding RTX toxin-like protein
MAKPTHKNNKTAHHKHQKGTPGDDVLIGGDGRDHLDGRAGDDILAGGSGKDHVRGNDGDDVLTGGSGSDHVKGGKGDDVAVYSVADNVGSKDKYDGGKGTDTLQINLTVVEFDQLQDELVRIQDYVNSDTGHHRHGHHDSRVFKTSFGLDIRNFESVVFMVEGVGEVDPSDTEPTNSNPETQSDEGPTDEDSVVLIDVLSNDTDPDGDTLTLTSVDITSGEGTATIVNGLVSYDPGDSYQHLNAGESVVVEITYTVDDGQGGTSAETAVVTVEGKDEVITGTEDNDVLEGTSGNDIISALGGGLDVIIGSDGDDVIYGGEGDDAINYGNLGFDVNVDLQAGTATGDGMIDSLHSINIVLGSSYDDMLIGGNTESDNFEYFYGGDGADTIDGGSGFDELSYYADPNGILADWAAGTVVDGWGNTDHFSNIERIRASAHDDTLIGNSDSTQFTGLAGDDIIDGGGGSYDQVNYHHDARYGGTAGVTVNLATGVATDGFGDTDSLSNIENVRGSSQDDVLIGDGGRNEFQGLAGDDYIDGGGGTNDKLQYFYEDGGQGIIADFTAGTVIDTFGDTDTIKNIEDIKGTNLADVVYGDDSNIGFSGYGGSDEFHGGSGWDVLFYSDDEDKGGEAEIEVNFTNGTVVDGFGDTDYFSGVEMVFGTSSGDTFIGGGDRADMVGLAGQDTFIGAGSNDNVSFDKAKYFGSFDGVTVNLAGGFAIDAFGDVDTLINIDKVKGTDFDDVIIGDEDNNSLRGHHGDDILSGGGGTWDNLDGGSGIDTAEFSGALADYSFEENWGQLQVIDSISNRDGTASLSNIEFLQFSDVTISIDDAPTIPSLFTDGNDDIDFNNVVAGTYSEGSQYDARDGNDSVTLASNQAAAAAAGFEAFAGHDGQSYEFSAGAGDDTVYGGALSEFIWGNEGNDRLFGGDGGGDFLVGGQGNDFLDGGSNEIEWYHDVVAFWSSTEGATVDLRVQDGVTAQFISASDGWDILVNFEDAHGSSYGDHFTGNDDDNSFFGLDGDDILIGLGGNDSFTAGAGYDNIDGGTGVDLAIFDYGATEGINVDLSAGVAYSDGTGASDTLVSIENVQGTNYSDVIVGDAGDNWLSGMDGDDVITGGGGNWDAIDGGLGVDTYIFSGSISEYSFLQSWGWSQLVVTDNVVGRDGMADLRDIEFLQFSDGTISIDDAPVIPSLFTEGDDIIDFNTVIAGTYSEGSQYNAQGGNDTVTLANDQAAADAAGYQTWNWFWAGQGEDIVYGGSMGDGFSGGEGDDYLYGNGGDDNIHGGAGNDLIDGGSDNGGGDSANYYSSTSGISTDLSFGLTSNDGHGGIDTLIDIENISGSEFADLIVGDSGVNRLAGAGGDDTIYGGGDHDWIGGGAGDDMLYGGTGGDGLFGGQGNDYIDGGEGVDDIRYDQEQDFAFSGVNVNLSTGVAIDGFGDTDTFINIENIDGSNYADILTGDENDNAIWGHQGNDTINGGAGSDYMDGQEGDDLFVFSNGDGNDAVSGFAVGAGSEDRIDLTAFGFTELSDLASVTQSGGDTIIQIDTDDSIRLIGVNVNDLHTDDFLF